MVGEGPLWSLNKTPNRGTILEETREANAGKGSFKYVTTDGGWIHCSNVKCLVV